MKWNGRLHASENIMTSLNRHPLFPIRKKGSGSCFLICDSYITSYPFCVTSYYVALCCHTRPICMCGFIHSFDKFHPTLIIILFALFWYMFWIYITNDWFLEIHLLKKGGRTPIEAHSRLTSINSDVTGHGRTLQMHTACRHAILEQWLCSSRWNNVDCFDQWNRLHST